MKSVAAVISLLFGLGVSDVAAQVRQQDRAVRPQQPGVPMRQDRALTQPPPGGAAQLYCRGGPMPGFEFHQWNAATSEIIVRFNKGARPAKQGLNPGECSWGDRAMGASEPAVFCQNVTDGMVIINYREEPSYRPPQFYVVQTFTSQSAPYLRSISQPNYQFTLNVKLQNSCLTVVQ